MNFKKITFIILLKDNPQQSKNLINYINNLPFKINIVIADGGKYKQQKIFQNISYAKKTYFYSGYDKNILTMYKKIYRALKIIKTEFIYFLDPGDFLNFETLKKCEKILDENRDKSIAIGIIYNFIKNKEKFIIKSELYKKRPLIKNKLFSRLISNFHLRSYHGLHRAKLLKKSVEIIIRHNLNDSRSCEFVMDTNNLFYGNFSLINNVHLLHEAPKVKKIHTINKKFSSREKWFKSYFSNVIKEILNDILIYHSVKSNRISVDKLVKCFFINDIQYNIKKKRLSVFDRIIDKTIIFFKNDVKLTKFIKTIQDDTKI